MKCQRSKNKCRNSSTAYPFLQLAHHIQIEIRSTNPDMATVFHANYDGRFIKVKYNLRRKELQSTNQGLNPFKERKTISTSKSKSRSNKLILYQEQKNLFEQVNETS